MTRLIIIVFVVVLLSKPIFANGPVYSGHDLPRLRGAMVSPRITEESIRTLGQQWNANLVRWQFVDRDRFPEGEGLDHDAYNAWLVEQIEQLDQVLPHFFEYGMMVVLDLHTFPDLFVNPSNQDLFVKVWQKLAEYYKGSESIWGYDLYNEPDDRTSVAGVYKWRDLAERTALAIREIDPEKTIIVEPSPGADPKGFVDFKPLNVPKIVYSAHMYLPHAFTHQGVHTRWPDTFEYPGLINGTFWNKTRLEKALEPVISFQNKYDVHIYIGEFSAIRWAPGESAFHYLQDLIDIFEKHEWDWTYHAFREFQGWSVEHGSNRHNPYETAQPTSRKELLLKWFGKNEKPTVP